MNSPNDIARWEILKGLPGEGPVPRHFHMGSPRPWREGLVVRFWNTSGTEWVGNFGRGGTPFSSVSDWSEAGFMVVVPSGALYFLSKNDSVQYITHCPDVTGIIFDEDKRLLICGRVGGKLVAYGREGAVAWAKDRVAVDQIKLKSCIDGVITAEVDDFDGASFHAVKICARDGAVVQA